MTDATDSLLPDLNLATAWEAVADTVPDHPAVVQGAVRRTWRDLEDRAARLAGHLAAAGLGPQSKVALYLYNSPEYLEATFAAFKLRAVPVNVNYRYLPTELAYLLDNADAGACVFSGSLVDRVDAVRTQAVGVRTWIRVPGPGDGPCPEWAVDLNDAVEAAEPAERIRRSGDDLWFLYTGGTTGMPKGVMWPHRSLMGTMAATYKPLGLPVPATSEQVGDGVRAAHAAGAAQRLLPAAPLMHGTSAFTTWAALTIGGTVVLTEGRSLDGAELCGLVADEAVTNLIIVGDAFAVPIVEELERAAAAGTPYDWSALRIVVSSGVMWSQPVKDRMLEHCGALLADLLGSSEGTGMAASVTKRGRSTPTARFRLGEHSAVFTEDGRRVQPGSGEVGIVAVGGPIPVGYYKDEAKTAATFREFEGRVWSMPGDFATVDAEGNIRLLGRGSQCINTAGEKVYPEEVEEVLKLHPAVADANVVGVPDAKWGQAVTAVVGLTVPIEGDAEAMLIEHSRSHLAGYKCPKRVVVVEQVLRGPNGKADYRWAGSTAREALGLD